MTNKYFVSELYPDAFYTAGILREDIETVLLQLGYSGINISSSRSNIFQRFSLYQKAIQATIQLNKPDIVLFHFPLRSRVYRYFHSLIQKKGIRSVAYVHDLEGLRDQNENILRNEMKWLKKFDIIISQNEMMKQVIERETGNKKIIILGMYDYMKVNPEKKTACTISTDIAFAGNLEKASFIYELDKLPEFRFIVYGKAVIESHADNIIYKGKVDPRLLPSAIEGSFGLVWDGNSIESGEGAGAYLRYNIPHKLALYIMAGMPLIIWKESAMARWVLEHNIGITVSSLSEIKDRIENLPEVEYLLFQENMIPIRNKMAGGDFLKAALQKVESMIDV